MKKSDLRQLIRECVQETLTEIRLDSLFKGFMSSGEVPAQYQDTFLNMFYPFLNKSHEDVELQTRLVKKLINAAVGAKLDPSDKDELRDYGINLDDKAVSATLSRLHPFLVKFLKYIGQNA
jgi:hypothetical protein